MNTFMAVVDFVTRLSLWVGICLSMFTKNISDFAIFAALLALLELSDIRKAIEEQK